MAEPASKRARLLPESLAGMDFSGKQVFVTGGSRGIGFATASLFVDLGANVIICARGLEALEKARSSMSCPERVHVMQADLSTLAGIQAAEKAYPHDELHVLVNNVGTNIRKKAEDFTDDEFEGIMMSNFFSAFRLSKAFLPRLQRVGLAGGACVVNISSVAAVAHIPSGAPYAASKAAMDQMTRNLAVEWSRYGIRVNSVSPGPIDTHLLSDPALSQYLDAFKARIPLGRMGLPIEVAQPIAFLASKGAAYITGQTLQVDGGFTSTSFNEVPGFWLKEKA